MFGPYNIDYSLCWKNDTWNISLYLWTDLTGSNSIHTPLIVKPFVQWWLQSICSNLQCEMKYLGDVLSKNSSKGLTGGCSSFISGANVRRTLSGNIESECISPIFFELVNFFLHNDIIPIVSLFSCIGITIKFFKSFLCDIRIKRSQFPFWMLWMGTNSEFWKRCF